MILEAQGTGPNLEIITKARGDVGDRIGQNAQTGTRYSQILTKESSPFFLLISRNTFPFRAIIDPQARVIGLRIYDSLFKVIPLEKDQSELKAYNIRMEELKVTDIEFLHGCPQPTVVLLHQDNNGRHVKTHEISLKDREFVKIPWKQDNVESEGIK